MIGFRKAENRIIAAKLDIFKSGTCIHDPRSLLRQETPSGCNMSFIEAACLREEPLFFPLMEWWYSTRLHVNVVRN